MYMQTRFHGRFKDAPWYSANDVIYVLVGGAGGIGSWTVFMLARAGFTCMMYDDDIIEEHNLGGQLYPIRAIGESKVATLAMLCNDFSGMSTYPECTRITKEGVPTHNYTIAAFDNIEARKILFEKWLDNYGFDSRAIFIDARLEAEQMWIYCVVGGVEASISKYKDKLTQFNDTNLEEASCTMKQTSHAAAMVASHIVGFLTNHHANIVQGNDDREVPHEWTYFIPLNLQT